MSRLKPSFLAALALSAFAVGCSSGGDSQAAPPSAEDGNAQALQAAVGEDQALNAFYAARQWRMAWDERAGGQLRETINGAVRHGLDPATFARGLDGGGSPAERDVAMTRAALSYAEALAHGRTDPKQLFNVYTLPRNEVDVTGGLATALDENRAGEWIESLAPQDEEYRALSAAYVEHLQAAQQPQPQPEQAGAPKTKQPPAAQRPPEGARDRAVVLAVNLERRRWLERDPARTRIDVNTAASTLRYIRDGSVTDQRVVVNGEPGWETPQLQSPIYRLVANPDWTVPASIERSELGSLSPAALSRRNMARENGRIVQQPGPTNALGLVKLDMKNDHAIYLHDTPSKAAFGQTERHLSHGCVRVQDALGFARMIADQTGKRADFDRALATRDTGFVDLGTEIPVRLLYLTAFADGGTLTFSADPYGWDAKVAEALGLAPPPASSAAEESAEAKRTRRASDVGP